MGQLHTEEGSQRSGILPGLEGREIFSERKGEKVCPRPTSFIMAMRKHVDVIKS